MTPSICIIVEHFDGKVRPVTFELAAFAQNIQKERPADMTFILLGDNIETMADEIVQMTGIDVLALKIPSLHSYNQEIFQSALSQWFSTHPFSYLLAAQTAQGMDFAPGLAVRTGAACVTSVEAIIPHGSTLAFKRSVFNGKAVSTLVPETEQTVLIVLPGMVKPNGFDNATPGTVHVEEISIAPEQIQNKGLVRSRTDSQTLVDAQVIISAGRGVGKKENLSLIYQLADRFSKSAVGGSRPICDLGWMGYQQQIGITGLSVSPRLYVACGISGALQHLSGIRSADFIVAVNTDPKAAIFNMADICIVEDMMSFIPVLIEEMDKATS